MRKYGVFDIIGPIMIGPSSSHTAGAARLAKVARAIVGKRVSSVRFLLHGSFATTYRGHGTDRALVAGILGMDPSDDRLRDSLEIAKKSNLQVSFEPADLGDVHPNTVRFILVAEDGDVHEVQGSSIGGGSIEITEIDGDACNFTGTYPTLIVAHRDTPGVVAEVAKILYDHNINIAFMRLLRQERGKSAAMIFETDNRLEDSVRIQIKEIAAVSSVVIINPIKE